MKVKNIVECGVIVIYDILHEDRKPGEWSDSP